MLLKVNPSARGDERARDEDSVKEAGRLIGMVNLLVEHALLVWIIIRQGSKSSTCRIFCSEFKYP